jgi:opacity protein-like surface antigen
MNCSRSVITGLTLALAALGCGAATALAGGEVIEGPPVRHQVPVAVPVPAPVPVPEIASGFYVRIDAAYSQGDTSKYRSTETHADLVRADSYLDNFPRFGFGVGYQYNRWLRGDITFDWRTDVESKGSGNVFYTLPNANGTTSLMRDTISDHFKSTNMTGMANAYLDVPVWHSVTPYVGAGIGFVRHQLRGLNYTRDTTCVDLVDCNFVPPGGAPVPGPLFISSGSATAGGVDVALAYSLMAGFTFQIAEWTKVDLGYRWLHLDGTTFVGRGGNIVQNLTIPDQNIHELRVGLRWDIN